MEHQLKNSSEVEDHDTKVDGNDDVNKCSCDEARRLWLQPVDDTSMNKAELLYRKVWSDRHRDVGISNNVDGDVHRISKKSKIATDNNNVAKDALVASGFHCSTWIRHAGEKLALILLQSGRTDEADHILMELDYPCRLSDLIMNYPLECMAEIGRTKVDDFHDDCQTVPCRVFNNFLSDVETTMFQTVFTNPNSDYWISHNYSVEPPSPYFSYLIPLRPMNDGAIFTFVQRLQTFLQAHFPIKNASYCEMWAHNRYHATGHQFHFDSDNEGCTESIRNPICSGIIYLSDEHSGGPSIITNQRLTSNQLATKGWMCHPKLGRLVVFDGKVLHGVVPGKYSSTTGSPTDDDTKIIDSNQRPRRVSVMFAFWRKIRVRENDVTNLVGAARVFPETPLWAKQLRKPFDSISNVTTATLTTISKTAMQPVAVEPLTLDHVYVSTKNSRPWTRNMGMPNYEEIFQGF